MVEDAEALLQGAVRDGRLKLPAGYYWEWSGQFENMTRVKEKLKVILPFTLIVIIFLIYFTGGVWLGFLKVMSLHEWNTSCGMTLVLAAIAAGASARPVPRSPSTP